MATSPSTFSTPSTFIPLASSTPSNFSFSSVQFSTSPFPTRKRPQHPDETKQRTNVKRRIKPPEEEEEPKDQVYTPCLFNLFMRVKNQERYKGCIKLLRTDYGGKPLFVLEPPPVLPMVDRVNWRLAFARFRRFEPPSAWGSVATSPRSASELLTGKQNTPQISPPLLFPFSTLSIFLPSTRSFSFIHRLETKGSPLPKAKWILAKDQEHKHLKDCDLIDPTLQKVTRGESLDDELFLFCHWSDSEGIVRNQTWERFDTLMRCENFLSPVQIFLCGGPSIEPCGHPLLIANSLATRVRKGEEALLYFQLWDDPEKPALRESELISTFNGWLA
jgi:hypothetical protein